MIGSLWRFNRNNIFMNKRIEMIFDNGNLIHSEITDPVPRLLQHLCRCSLRQRLADNHQLPEGTQNLGLPKVLKEYIDLETLLLTFKNAVMNLAACAFQFLKKPCNSANFSVM
ncbi:hypothetical protein NPIL_653701 [Nephila pilipes]|uniref:SOCS box domain-containing protein n=1 Tax=Nephila pilipes TaxID=299642 RepID=A0A8X6TJK3_NEPPI|nr:hypothetical protein NPIL_653701 [Nephila pilipes]